MGSVVESADEEFFNSKTMVVGNMNKHSKSEDDMSESSDKEKEDESITSNSKRRR